MKTVFIYQIWFKKSDRWDLVRRFTATEAARVAREMWADGLEVRIEENHYHAPGPYLDVIAVKHP